MSQPRNHMTTQESSPLHGSLFDKLQQSSLYRTYQRAFHQATGLPLILQNLEEESPLLEEEYASQNTFCRSLTAPGHACSQCIASHRLLGSDGPERACTSRCFAGLQETGVPIRCGGVTVAQLRTGQVFTAEAKDADFDQLRALLVGEGWTASELRELQEAYAEVRVIPASQYDGIVTLLTAFAVQLSELVNRILLEHREAEPGVVRRAKQFISAHLEEPLSLEAVAAHANVSPFYFCKLFKQSTGMTFTQFVNRRRVERAKKRLQQPEVRITEVAFEVGFQSLSQFNRSFLKYAGESPTRYRDRIRKTDRILAA